MAVYNLTLSDFPADFKAPNKLILCILPPNCDLSVEKRINAQIALIYSFDIFCEYVDPSKGYLNEKSAFF